MFSDTATRRTNTARIMLVALSVAAGSNLSSAQTTVGNLVWEDVNGDGIQDVGETGVPDVAVKVFSLGADGEVGGGDDGLTWSNTTNASGEYLASLPGGTYYVQFFAPAGTEFSPRNQGDGTDDSDADAEGRSGVFTVVGDGSDSRSDIDCGLVPLTTTVRGQVFDDLDGDGVREDGEGAIGANATVKLFNTGDDGAIGGGDDVEEASVDTTTTYTFADVASGTYYVGFTAPAGWGFVSKDQGDDDTVDSDVNPETGYTAVFTIPAADDEVLLDAGLNAFGSVTGKAFLDDDEDGVQVGTEPGVANVLVALFKPGEDGEVGTADDTLVSSDVSDTDGAYELTRVVAGDYYIAFTAAPGFAITLQDEGEDDTVDSDANPTTGLTDVFAVPASSEVSNVDVGMRADADNDGTPDSADGCPNDANKTAPGECGCGVLDTDADEDGVPDCDDNCPDTANPDQNDFDEDGVGDLCDNCPDTANVDQVDADEDGLGDACDADVPADGLGPGDIISEPNEAGGPGGTEDQGEDQEDGGDLTGLEALCAACGNLGLVTYALTLVGYASFLRYRRRR